MTIKEAVKKFAGDFDSIPAGLIIKAYKDDPENLECLNTPEFLENIYLECWPAMWGWLFRSSDWTDEEWIKCNIEKVEACGFLIYNCEYCGILLGVNGCGYNFHDTHWLRLYKARELSWHNEKEEEEK
jgi:hypothetical protein